LVAQKYAIVRCHTIYGRQVDSIDQCWANGARCQLRKPQVLSLVAQLVAQLNAQVFAQLSAQVVASDTTEVLD
jgi:hypothetical protein